MVGRLNVAADATCPRCGSGDRLETQERVTALYPVRFPAGWQRVDGEAPPYTGERAGRALDDTAVWDGELHCRDCGWAGHWSELK